MNLIPLTLTALGILTCWTVLSGMLYITDVISRDTAIGVAHLYKFGIYIAIIAFLLEVAIP